VAARCGVLVIAKAFPDPLSGLLMEVDGGAVIGVNAAHAAVRRRFTIAHELGHHLLAHSNRFHLDVGDGGPPGQDYASERAANDFAAEILMPRRLVAAAIGEAVDTPALARAFDVSEIAMGYRLVNLGYR